MKATLSSIALALASLLATAGALRAGPVLVGNKSLAGKSLNADDVKAVLLGKRTAIDNTRVVIVVSKANDVQDAFLRQYVGMTTYQFLTHWRRLFMSGGGSAPKVVEDEMDAVKLVGETEGAIAIADAANAGDLPILAGK